MNIENLLTLDDVWKAVLSKKNYKYLVKQVSNWVILSKEYTADAVPAWLSAKFNLEFTDLVVVLGRREALAVKESARTKVIRERYTLCT